MSLDVTSSLRSPSSDVGTAAYLNFDTKGWEHFFDRVLPQLRGF